MNNWDCALLKRHLTFYIALESGERRPSTQAQKHFVAVCEGHLRPRTQHEIAFQRYRRLYPDQMGEAAARDIEVRGDEPTQAALDVVEKIDEASLGASSRRTRRTLKDLKALYLKGAAKGRNRITDAALWTTTILSEPDLARSVERWFSDAHGSLSNIYTKAIDGSYATFGLQPGDAYISPWLHRLFDHSPQQAWEAVRNAVPDDTIAQEIVNYIKAMGSDLVTVVGLPVTDLTRHQYETLRSIVSDELGIPEAWLVDALHYNATELIGAGLPGLALALNWNRSDAETLSRLAGGLGIGAVVAANPILAIIAVATLARAYQHARSSGNPETWINGVVDGGAASGALLAVSGVVGGPVWIGLVAGVGTICAVTKLGKQSAVIRITGIIREWTRRRQVAAFLRRNLRPQLVTLHAATLRRIETP